MRIPTTPAVALAAGFREIYGAGTDRPEHELWRAVLNQEVEDLFSLNERIHQDAITFFESPDLLLILDYAGLGRDCAPLVKTQVLELASTSQHPPQPPGKRITFRGETHSLMGWAKLTGLSIHALGYRLRAGWSIEQTLTTPGRQQTATAA